MSQKKKHPFFFIRSYIISFNSKPLLMHGKGAVCRKMRIYNEEWDLRVQIELEIRIYGKETHSITQGIDDKFCVLLLTMIGLQCVKGISCTDHVVWMNQCEYVKMVALIFYIRPRLSNTVF